MAERERRWFTLAEAADAGAGRRPRQPDARPGAADRGMKIDALPLPGGGILGITHARAAAAATWRRTWPPSAPGAPPTCSACRSRPSSRPGWRRRSPRRASPGTGCRSPTCRCPARGAGGVGGHRPAAAPCLGGGGPGGGALRRRPWPQRDLRRLPAAAGGHGPGRRSPRSAPPGPAPSRRRNRKPSSAPAASDRARLGRKYPPWTPLFFWVCTWPRGQSRPTESQGGVWGGNAFSSPSFPAYSSPAASSTCSE